MSQFSKNVTFQTFPYPPPPPPPPTDQQFLKEFESRIKTPKPRKKINKRNAWMIRVQLLSLISTLRDMKTQEEMLGSNSELSEDEWKCATENIETNKEVVTKTSISMSGLFVEAKRKFFTRREAKRRRLHRRNKDYRHEKLILMEKRDENSLKIFENLQKIKEDILRAEQDEEAKRQTDIVLKEVLRKKHDAKKSIAKLDALIKLKQARVNTARGKGHSVSENDVAAFQTFIENLKSLWIFKLSTYEVEETELRKTLEEWKNSLAAQLVSEEQRVLEDLASWHKAIFGTNVVPQADFKGNIREFIRVRSQWDRYIDDGPESTPIPAGWVWHNKA